MAQDKGKAMATEFAKDSAKAKSDRKYVMNPAEFDKQETIEFGGQSEILELDVNECAGPFEYQGHQPMILESGETTVHLGALDGDLYRLPISSAFLRCVDQARLRLGDVFAIKRLPDVAKKAGKGKGQTMKIYSLKVIERAEVASEPVAAK